MYHYTECGLLNVWLENGYTKHETQYGSGVSICDVDGLHQALALAIADKEGSITGKELRFIRTMLDLSQSALGKLVGSTEQSVSLWERRGRVPKAAEIIIRMMLLEKLNGNVKVAEIIAKASFVDRVINQRIVATEKRHKWASKIAAASDERFALAA
ncbi:MULTISPECIES: transcriptional regulator [unclassified Acidovorax]|jgi:putative transcriptional regulator|uniref:transcriptional regulator n=1 Tax=unclassified Acidovorax TaxID=2684926 RepID=UPI001C484A1E|nr:MULTISPECIES: transcriptional regulator [unclassified Acidovorax]MBV7460600.1 transcriptional regulator [Acidovorax sp. sif0632]MBV7465625.1 transcriptional regulator [Acidovorax sp. sif0613]